MLRLTFAQVFHNLRWQHNIGCREALRELVRISRADYRDGRERLAGKPGQRYRRHRNIQIIRQHDSLFRTSDVSVIPETTFHGWRDILAIAGEFCEKPLG